MGCWCCLDVSRRHYFHARVGLNNLQVFGDLWPEWGFEVLSFEIIYHATALSSLPFRFLNVCIRLLLRGQCGLLEDVLKFFWKFNATEPIIISISRFFISLLRNINCSQISAIHSFRLFNFVFGGWTAVSCSLRRPQPRLTHLKLAEPNRRYWVVQD